MRIEEARKDDAEFVGQTVTGAIGEELCLGLAETEERLPLVDKLFGNLAVCEDSQYSYRNALIARTPEGEIAGAIIAYDGARLHALRKAFIREANAVLGWNVTAEDEADWEDETGPDEIYIDSLYVKPEYRGHGVATALINGVIEKYSDSGKPFGLLVEPENTTARCLYDRLGFRKVGVNRFCGVPMDHLLNPKPSPSTI